MRQISAIVLSVAISLGALVSEAPLAWSQPDAGNLLQQQKQLDMHPGTPPELPAQKETPPPRPSKENGVKVHVTKFVLEGDIQAFPRSELLHLLDRFRDTDMGFADLQKAANIITQYYHKHGYFLAHAYLPKQDVSRGVIIIKVIEGKVEKDGLDIKGHALRLDRNFAKRMIFDASRPGRPLRKDELERGILLVNDLPGISSSLNLTPGRKPGTTHLTLHASEGNLFTGHISLDNYGSRYTGIYRVVTGVEINDLSGHGDQFDTEFTKAINGQYQFLTTGYSLPLGYSGFRAGIHGSRMLYAVGKEYASLGLKGTVSEWSVDGRYPVIRSLDTNLNLICSWTRLLLYNESLGVPTSQKALGFWNMGISANHVDRLGRGGFTGGSVNWTFGRLDLGGNLDNLLQDQGAGGAHTNGAFSKLNWNVSRIQRGMKRVTLIARFSGQVAMKNLDSAQKMQLGGPTGIRAYPPGEAAGDDGVRMTLEAHYLAMAATPLGDWNLVGFYDWGRIRQNHNATGMTLTTPNAYALAGYGAGLTVGKPGKYSFRIGWATPVGANPGRNASTGVNADGLKAGARVWARLQMYV